MATTRLGLYGGPRTARDDGGVGPTILSIEAGVLRLAGQDVAAQINGLLDIQPGTLRLNGLDVEYLPGAELDVEPGTLRLQGQDIALIIAQPTVLSIEPGTLGLKGQDVRPLSGQAGGGGYPWPSEREAEQKKERVLESELLKMLAFLEIVEERVEFVFDEEIEL